MNCWGSPPLETARRSAGATPNACSILEPVPGEGKRALSRILFVSAPILVALPLTAFQSDKGGILAKLGHSQHGEAFDTGPREKPWPIEGIGTAHFPITTKNPEVQRWFDQGNALLHDFIDYEAERAFRWCLKLEPDNAMAYWGLARASMLRGMGGNNRPAEMIREAVKRKDRVSPREQLYIDALAADVLPDMVH